MASLFAHWYDLLCLAMVAAVALGSLWAITAGERASRRRRRKVGGDHKDALLLAADDEEEAEADEDAVYGRELWMSRWRAVHPAALLGLRVAAAATMVGVLVWDLRTYDWSIMLYYTESMAAGEEEQGFGYWLRWQVPVCAVILAVPAVTSALAISRARADPLRSTDLWVSCWKNVSPFWLLGFRALALLSLCWLLARVSLLDGAFAFYFYTQWTCSLVIVYFSIASVISAHGCWIYAKCGMENDEINACLKTHVAGEIPVTSTGNNRNRKANKWQSYGDQGGDHDEKAGFWGYLMQIAYQTSAGAVALTDIVFWGLLVPFLSVQHFKLDLLMGCMHTLNFVFLLLDTALNSLPFPWFRMAYLVLWSSIYVAFQWILHACGFSWWPYPFLELSSPLAPLWYLSLSLIHIPCYGLYRLLVNAKNSLFRKFFHRACRRP